MLWELASGVLVRSFEGHASAVRSVALSADGRFALSGSEDKTLKLRELANGALVRSFEGHARGVRSVALSADGRFALSGSNDKTLKLWDTATGQAIDSFTGEGSFYCVIFGLVGRRILAGDVLGRVHLFELRL